MATAVEHMTQAMTRVLHDQDTGARTITYNGTDLVCRVIFGRRRNRDRNDKTMVRVAWIRVLKSDIPAPKYQDRVVIGSETWIVAEVEQQTWWDHRLRLETSRRQAWR